MGESCQVRVTQEEVTRPDCSRPGRSFGRGLVRDGRAGGKASGSQGRNSPAKSFTQAELLSLAADLEKGSEHPLRAVAMSLSSVSVIANALRLQAVRL